MGKGSGQRAGTPETLTGVDGNPCGELLAGIRRGASLRCVAVVILSVCLLVSAVFWILPPRRGRDGGEVSASIQASFILQKPISLLSAHTERLEYDIFEEIGVPDSKVSIVSLHQLVPASSTFVVFGVLPNPRIAHISSPALSLLRSSFTELVLKQLNLTLTPSLFGDTSSFEVLRFPGGITVIPPQTSSIWERTQSLFDFELNYSIFDIQKYFDELKNQLRHGLHLEPYENVYVQMRNDNGSTVSPPVTVNASILYNDGSQIISLERLKQLAHFIVGSHAKNLGLNHSVFGRVKQVQLSSYLEHSIASGQSPSLSPSPSPSPSPAPTPIPSSLSFPSPSSSPSPSPSPFPFPSPSPIPSSSPSPTPSPSGGPSTGYPFPHPYTSPNSAPDKSPRPSTWAPELSPLSPAASYSSTPPTSESHMLVSPSILPSKSSHVGPHLYVEVWSIGLLLFVVLHQLHDPN